MWAQRGMVNLADGVLMTAAALLAVSITRSPLEVSLVSASATLPWLLTTLFAGVVADRYDRRRVMLVTNLVRVLALAAGVAVVVTGRCRCRCCARSPWCSAPARSSTTPAPRRWCPRSSRRTGSRRRTDGC